MRSSSVGRRTSDGWPNRPRRLSSATGSRKPRDRATRRMIAFQGNQLQLIPSLFYDERSGPRRAAPFG